MVQSPLNVWPNFARQETWPITSQHATVSTNKKLLKVPAHAQARYSGLVSFKNLYSGETPPGAALAFNLSKSTKLAPKRSLTNAQISLYEPGSWCANWSQGLAMI